MACDRNAEDPADSCRSILQFMRRCDGTDDDSASIREALLEDLYDKCRGMDSSTRSAFLIEGLYHCRPNRIRELYTSEMPYGEKPILLPVHLREHRNIGIVTVIQKELAAALRALGRKSNAKEDASYSPFRYWFGQIPREESSHPLSYVLTVVGEPRNVPCALAVEHLLWRYDLDLLVLIGIAAGVQDKVKLGDVVASKNVYDYECVRSESDNDIVIERQRSAWFPVAKDILEDLALFDGTGFSRRFKRLMRDVPNDWLPPRTNRGDIVPSFHPATLAAGERLFADGALIGMWNKEETIRAGDMEDSGFAQACHTRGLPWVVFRGIVDFGDPHKNSDWHSISSLSAASAAVTFLATSYRPSFSTSS